MAIQRWDPQRNLMELQEKMNRMFDDALSRSAGSGSAEALGSTTWKPPIDLVEEAARYVLRADLPGVVVSEVELQIEEGTLFLRGERRMDSDLGREAYLRIERPHGRFAVQVALPPSVDRSMIQATHRNGVIEIVLPKKKEESPSRVEISTP